LNCVFHIYGFVFSSKLIWLPRIRIHGWTGMGNLGELESLVLNRSIAIDLLYYKEALKVLENSPILCCESGSRDFEDSYKAGSSYITAQHHDWKGMICLSSSFLFLFSIVYYFQFHLGRVRVNLRNWISNCGSQTLQSNKALLVSSPKRNTSTK
jgi:hypothetical protein